VSICGGLAVISGSGMSALFESLGFWVLDGGPTLNPSTYDLLAAIHAVPAEEVIVLPNSANVQMAAERAAELSDKTVVVVACRSQQGGLAAAVRGRPQAEIRSRLGDLATRLDPPLAPLAAAALAEHAAWWADVVGWFVDLLTFRAAMREEIRP